MPSRIEIYFFTRGWRQVGCGSNAAKLAEAVKLSYFRGPDYFEVDADIVGSAVARRILSVVRSATSTLVLDLALVIEGVDGDELPERILGAVREAPAFIFLKARHTHKVVRFLSLKLSLSLLLSLLSLFICSFKT